VLIKEMQSLALDVKVLGDVGEEIALRESVDDEVTGLEVNIEGSEVDSIPEKRVAKSRDDDFSELSFDELEVPDIDGLGDIDIDIDSGMAGSPLADDDLDSFDDDLDLDLGDDEDADEDADEDDDEGLEKDSYSDDDFRGKKHRDDNNDLDSLDGLVDNDDELFDDDDFDK
jgi:hypothetical protein